MFIASVLKKNQKEKLLYLETNDSTGWHLWMVPHIDTASTHIIHPTRCKSDWISNPSTNSDIIGMQDPRSGGTYSAWKKIAETEEKKRQ